MSKYEDYGVIHQEIFVRISDLPVVDSLRDLRHFHLGVLIKVNGVVTRRTGIFPQLRILFYNCTKCGNVIGPFSNVSEKEVDVGMCPECQSAGPFTLNSEQTVYRNFQKLTLQEAPGSVPAGRVPRSKEVILLADLVDSVRTALGVGLFTIPFTWLSALPQCRPGDEVDITGVYTHNFDASLNTRQGFPVFATVIEANFVVRRQDARASSMLTEEDRRKVLELSREPNIAERVRFVCRDDVHGLKRGGFIENATFGEDADHQVTGPVHLRPRAREDGYCHVSVRRRRKGRCP